MIYEKEETYLSPLETKWEMDGFLIDATNAHNANWCMEFSVVFSPLTDHDGKRLDEFLKGTMSRLELSLPRHSRKNIRPSWKTKRGFYVSSQLFTPRFSLEYERADELKYRKGKFSGHLRDDPSGVVFLQLDYLDFFPEEETPTYVDKNPVCYEDW